ncbi:hypothetical protein D3C84_1140880 [compost metagenome]
MVSRYPRLAGYLFLARNFQALAFSVEQQPVVTTTYPALFQGAVGQGQRPVAATVLQCRDLAIGGTE